MFSNSNFIKKLDIYYSKEDIIGAEQYLNDCYLEAKSENNVNALLNVLNEQVGLFRQTNNESEGIKSINEIIKFINYQNIENTIHGGTYYLNCATTMKSFNRQSEALPLYDKAYNILTNLQNCSNVLLSGLFNNYALCLQDLKKYNEANDLFNNALKITLKDDSLILEAAITYVNIAHLYNDMNYDMEMINDNLNKAISILKNKSNESLPKYAYTCRKCAPSFGYFGLFMDELFLNRTADRIYENNRIM